jgi:hypothetical protein
MAKAKTETAKTEAKAEVINFHNETTTVEVHPVADAPAAFATIVRVDLIAGRTVPAEGTKERSAWRVKAMHKDNEWIEPNALKAANACIRALFGGTKYHDVAAAVKDFQLPELGSDKEEEAATDWTKFENAAELAVERDLAGVAAEKFFRGETDMRAGLKELGVHIANVADSLEKPKAFVAWVKSGSVELQRALANKNDKAELIFVGKLPDDWFAKQPETSNSAKAYQRNFNLVKNDIAGDLANATWGKKQKFPSVGECQKAFKETLDALRDMENEKPTEKMILARHFFDFLTIATEDWTIDYLVKAEGGVVPAKDDQDAYIAGTQFGTGNRVHELVKAYCAEMVAQAPEAKAEAESRKTEEQVAKALRPKVFAEYGVTEAAMHLARILSAHDNWSEVLDTLNSIADRAEAETWAQVLADVANNVDAEKAEAETEEAEEDAEDAA